MHKLALCGSAARAVFAGSSGLPAHNLLGFCLMRHQTRRRTYTQDQVKNNTGHFNCYRLQHRTLINLSGHDTNSFLQGIITNDMGLLEEDGTKAMYAHTLNVQGRTLYDIIIYSLKENPSGLKGVLLECDGSVQESIIKHLKMYKIRRKVNISMCTNLSLWALLPQNKDDLLKKTKPNVTTPEKVFVLEVDPRTEFMGWRLITSHEVNPVEIISACHQGNTEEYHQHRYEIGLPEGVKDLPPGEALPLESNLVYMRGISFIKGCYIGQELTARTHHTGVIRKRLMPVTLSAPVENVDQGAVLETEGGKPAGKHRAGIGLLGLSLVRTAHAREPLKLKSSDNTTVTSQATVPYWWPKNTKDK
ncbi:putative transferase CAF17 homolog, mitochondrial [Triplophysa rosa]|uniref:Iron-sulfur cluster assembly factor IBA57, mitochondrial n=1 Tax=Triplophysa rosa TaxID=992332 RepID=A0A9W8C8G5_TRIRA|nr:putative transferase CAF17 homolog, mitochondrial [Triplophysa rosa]KAI7810254.1 putative transferase CAF17-like protein [Triplophysa rosa]